LLQVFSGIIFPQPPENHKRGIFEIFRKFAEIFASQGASPVSTTPVVRALSCQYLGGLFVKVRNSPYGRWGKLIHEKT
jgi:hypothetical protein